MRTQQAIKEHAFILHGRDDAFTICPGLSFEVWRKAVEWANVSLDDTRKSFRRGWVINLHCTIRVSAGTAR